MRGLLERCPHQADPRSRRGKEVPEERREQEDKSEGESFIYEQLGGYEQRGDENYVEKVKRQVMSPSDFSLKSS